MKFGDVPTVVMIVKNGKGGPNKDSIPVYDRIPPGTRVDYLKNETLVRCVDPSYAGANKSKYIREWNGSTYLNFIHPKIADDVFCELNSHLYPFTPEIGSGETETYEVITDVFQNGKRTIELKKQS